MGDEAGSRTSFREELKPVRAERPKSLTQGLKQFTKRGRAPKDQFRLAPNVHRSYPDFVLLRKSLSERHRGMLLPPLPPSSSFSDKLIKPKEFQRKRAEALAFFVEALLENEFTAEDESVQGFLTLRDAELWRDRVKTITREADEFGSPLFKESSWNARLRAVKVGAPEADDAEGGCEGEAGRSDAADTGSAVLTAALKELSELEGALKTLKAAAKQVIKESQARSLCDDLIR